MNNKLKDRPSEVAYIAAISMGSFAIIELTKIFKKANSIVHISTSERIIAGIVAAALLCATVRLFLLAEYLRKAQSNK